MYEPLELNRKCRVLALLWHAPQEFITAGGFRRIYEIFDRTPDGVQVYAVDDNPSFLQGIACRNVRVVEYRIPGLVRRLERRFFWFERVLEWIIATLMMAFVCMKLRGRGDRFDVVFVPSSEQIPAMLAGILAKHLFRIPLVACNLNIDIFPCIMRKPLTRLHNRADKVIAISEHLAGEMKAYGLRSPVETNGVGLDTSKISAVAEPGDKTYEAIFVGRHDTEKGVFDLIEIWNLVTKLHPAARLVMIGSSNPINKAKLDTLIARYGLQGRVLRMGTVDDRQKYSLIKSSKLCLFPSYVEEWGIVPQEALACGLPVITYDLPVYEENIKPSEAVFREPIGDISGMARRTSEMLTGQEYLKYKRIGPDFVRRFDWGEVAVREFEIIVGQSREGPGARPARCKQDERTKHG